MKVNSRIFLSEAMMKPSLCTTLVLGLSKSEQSTGITVSDTMNEAIMLAMVAIAMGVNSLPATPVRISKGTKTRMMNIVA